ncbi:MAG: winged helix-turn-helix transcriptional regulator [Candidatus Marsarchaeota archaeon]|nr:winged helix-turn-helix transcriptional regulator [Candidatus Marsarchaeota archaeon]
MAKKRTESHLVKGRDCIIEGMMNYNELPPKTLKSLIESNWQLVVVSIINSKETGMFFNDILSKSGLTAKTLSAVLKSLQSDKMVSRKVFDTSPVRVKYTATDLGRKLFSSGCPIIELKSKI